MIKDFLIRVMIETHNGRVEIIRLRRQWGRAGAGPGSGQGLTIVEEGVERRNQVQSSAKTW